MENVVFVESGNGAELYKGIVKLIMKDGVVKNAAPSIPCYPNTVRPQEGFVSRLILPPFINLCHFVRDDTYNISRRLIGLFDKTTNPERKTT